MGYRDYQWAPYVSVADRRAKAAKHRQTLEKKGHVFNPVVINGRKITKTFWGQAWCNHLEAYSDFSNRLPRGRTYVRNGSVIDLKITKGQVQAQVMGSSLYHVNIEIASLPASKWKALIKACVGKIDSLIELLLGTFSKAVMEVITGRENGLFPQPKEIKMSCSCPDGARMCKHVAAVLYGVGASLDHEPEGLFALRHVDHLDLVATADAGSILTPAMSATNAVEDSELSALFGIDMDEAVIPAKTSEPLKKPRGRPRRILTMEATSPAKPKGRAGKAIPVTKAKASKAKPAKRLKK